MQLSQTIIANQQWVDNLNDVFIISIIKISEQQLPHIIVLGTFGILGCYETNQASSILANNATLISLLH